LSNLLHSKYNLYLESWLLYNKGVIDFILSSVFKEPGRSGGQQAQKIDTNQRLLKSEKNIYARIINDLNNIITQEANAQTPTPTPAENLTTLLNTNVCEGCDLENADLCEVDLSEAKSEFCT